MKNERQIAILDLIKNSDIETQEELIKLLSEKGFQVTQATISRDIRELKITKSAGENGKYKYVQHTSNDSDNYHAYNNAISVSVVSVESSMNLVVIKTLPGMAQGVAAALDSLEMLGFMGSVAGDDTIFVAFRTSEHAVHASQEIKNIAEK